MAADNDTNKRLKSTIVVSAKGEGSKFIPLEEAGKDAQIIVSSVVRNKGGFVSKKDLKGQTPELNLEGSLKEILKFLVYNHKLTLDAYNSQSEKIDKTNDHLGNIENDLSNLEKYFGQLTSFFSKQDEEDEKDAVENSFQKINNQHLKNILIVEQKQLKELEMLNEQFIDFFEMNEKNIQDQKEQTIEREREAAAPPPLLTTEQPKQEASTDIKKNKGIFSGGIFNNLGTIFTSLGSILRFIPGLLRFIPGLLRFIPGLLRFIPGLGTAGALGYIGFKYLTDEKYKAGIDNYLDRIGGFFKPLIGIIKKFFDTPIGKSIKIIVGDLWSKVKAEFNLFMKTFLGEEVWKKITDKMDEIKKTLSEFFNYENLSKSIKRLANSVINLVNTLIPLGEPYELPFPEEGTLARKTPPKPTSASSETPIIAREESTSQITKTPTSMSELTSKTPLFENKKVPIPDQIYELLKKNFGQDADEVAKLIFTESGGDPRVRREIVDQAGKKTGKFAFDTGLFQFIPTTALDTANKLDKSSELRKKFPENLISKVQKKQGLSEEEKEKVSQIVSNLTPQEQIDLYKQYIKPVTNLLSYNKQMRIADQDLSFPILKSYGFASGKVPDAISKQDLYFPIYTKEKNPEFWTEKQYKHLKDMDTNSDGIITYGELLYWTKKLEKIKFSNIIKEINTPTKSPNIEQISKPNSTFIPNFDGKQIQTYPEPATGISVVLPNITKPIPKNIIPQKSIFDNPQLQNFNFNNKNGDTVNNYTTNILGNLFPGLPSLPDRTSNANK